MRRPLVWMTLFYVIGEVFYRLWGVNSRAFFHYGLCIIICVSYLVIFFLFCLSRQSKMIQKDFVQYRKIRYFLKDPVVYLLPLFVLMGSISVQNAMKPHPLEEEFDAAGEVTIEGKCVKVIKRSQSVRYELTDCLYQTDDGGKMLGTVLVTFSEEEAFEPGNIVRVKGKIFVLQSASNRGQFDQKEYYLAQGIHFTMKGEYVEIISKGHLFPYTVLYRLRLRVKEVYKTSLSEEEAGVLSAMVLGDKEFLPEETRDLYQSAGISHILAISGLHVSMFGMALYRMLSRICRRKEWPFLATVLFLAAYAILTGASVSTIRAVWMLVVLLAAGMIGRTYDTASALAAAALGILVSQPLQLFQCGFQLSFGAVLSITMIFPALQSCLKCDGKRRKNSFLDAFLVSASVFLGTFPCLAYFYYEVSVCSTLLNLFVLPLASILLLSAAIGGLTGCVFLPLGSWILLIDRLILWFYKELCQISQRIPGHKVVTGKPELWQITIYFVLVILFLILVRSYGRRVLLVLFASFLIFLPDPCPKGLMVSCLDVGQGDCLFIKTPSHTTILVDGGSSTVSNVGTYRIEPFLKSYRCSRLDYVFLSHLDNDHINGVKELLMTGASSPGEHIAIANLVIGDSIKEEEKAEELKVLMEKTGGKIHYFKAGDALTEPGVTFRCVHPGDDFTSDDANSMSLVMELLYDDFSMLFTGDLDAAGEQALLADRRLSLSSYDVLKAGHHGSKYSTTQEFLDRVGPSLALLSYGKTNRYGHPHEEVLKRLCKKGRKVLSTGENGEIDLIKRAGRPLRYRVWGSAGLKIYLTTGF